MPVSGWTEGIPFLSRWTCKRPWTRPTCSQRNERGCSQCAHEGPEGLARFNAEVLPLIIVRLTLEPLYCRQYGSVAAQPPACDRSGRSASLPMQVQRSGEPTGLTEGLYSPSPILARLAKADHSGTPWKFPGSAASLDKKTTPPRGMVSAFVCDSPGSTAPLGFWPFFGANCASRFVCSLSE
jgi:hypothetical protein